MTDILFDTDSLSADFRAYRATRVASDMIERAARGGSETRSGIDPGGGVAEAGSQEWHASEHAGPAGQESREGPCQLFRSGETAGWRACDALNNVGGVKNGSISEILDKAVGHLS